MTAPAGSLRWPERRLTPRADRTGAEPWPPAPRRRPRRQRQGWLPIAIQRPDRHGADARAAAPDDLDLMRRLRAGDGEALAALYDRHGPAVHGLARAILRDGRLAEEVTHDVFLGLWQQPRAFDPARGVFAGWLLRVARNRAIDLLRRRRERPFAADNGVADGVTQIADPEPDPADQAAATLVREDVRAALTQLTPDHRRLLELAYFEGLSQRQIALRLDRPLGTVKSQIRAAMHRLADLLADPDAAASRTAVARPPLGQSANPAGRLAAGREP